MNTTDAIMKPAMAGTRENAKDEYKDFGKDKLNALTEIFNQKATITKNYEVKRTFKADWKVEQGTTIASDAVNSPEERDPSVIRTVAGEPEKPDYKLSTPLKSAMMMFQQDKPAEYKARNKLSKPRANPRTTQRAAPSVPAAAAAVNPAAAIASGIVRSSDAVDDRPKQLTTSLEDAKKKFEMGDGASAGNTPSRQMPLWEGKTGASKLDQGAKKLFEESDFIDEPVNTEVAQPITLPTAEPELSARSVSDGEEIHVAESEPEKISCFQEQPRGPTPEIPISSPEPAYRTSPETHAADIVENCHVVSESPEQQHVESPEPINGVHDQEPESTQLDESPTKESSFSINAIQQYSHKSSKDEDYDSADVMSDAGTTTSHENDNKDEMA